MPLQLDRETGYLAPSPEFHDATADELRDHFVQPYDQLNRRHLIWGAYVAHRATLARLLESVGIEQWIDGSFTTTKPDANDVDFASFVGAEHLRALPVGARAEARDLFQGPLTHPDRVLDSYLVVVETDANGQESAATRKSRDYWRRWFGHDRFGTPKGIARTMVGGAE